MKKLTQAARNKMVEDNLGLATSFAKSFEASRMEFDDLIQEARLGLIDAAELYDPARGTKFSTYARWHILKRVMDSIHNRNEIVRTPRRRPSLICGSLDDENAAQFHDPAPDVGHEIDEQGMVVEVQRIIGQLPSRESIVIRLRHGVNTPKLTLARVGAILGVSPERVRQIQSGAEEKLRTLMRESAIIRDQEDA